ncbi:hypothetical protein BKA65DRAFT_473231 [Rhexocercosporidium sp. MPI-PUGE-AT-0058]|nr:hypothetical protein BKA65DRAFT_473231 [Rhexocercosporidium sp. MPI-PUGE-AT-0058]
MDTSRGGYHLITDITATKYEPAHKSKPQYWVSTWSSRDTEPPSEKAGALHVPTIEELQDYASRRHRGLLPVGSLDFLHRLLRIGRANYFTTAQAVTRCTESHLHSHIMQDIKLCGRCAYVLNKLPAKRQVTNASFTHHLTGPDILTAANDGCRVCEMLVSELQSRLGTRELDEMLRHMNQTGCVWTGDPNHLCQLEITIYPGYPFIPLPEFCTLKLCIQPLEPTSLNSFLISKFGTPQICGSISSNSTGPDSCWDQILIWHRDCLQNHQRCSQARSKPGQGSTWYPTRLLYVGVQNNPTIRLAITATLKIKGYYMTLSHRWGTGYMYKLTSATLSRLLTGVPISELPRTFQEAIEITRRLSARFLWIDSLCIIQDSIDDWRKESLQMMHQAQATLGEGDERRCFIYDQELLLKGLTIAPLNQRAWVMQERLLAPRVVHFAKTQLFWECHERTACEMFPNQIPRDATYRDDGLGKSLDAGFLSQNHNSVYPMPHSQYSFWMWDLLVKQYMGCAITNPQDKLIAIGGLAQYIAGTMDDEDTYLAGLWKSQLPAQLLWRVIPSYTQANHSPSYRPSDYRAPSWSWASVEADIDMALSNLRRQKRRDLVTIEEISVTPLGGGSAFGQLVGGWIQLRGMLLTRLRIEVRDDLSIGIMRHVVTYSGQDERWRNVDIYPDVSRAGVAQVPQYADFYEATLEVWNDNEEGADIRRQAGCELVQTIGITIPNRMRNGLELKIFVVYDSAPFVYEAI